MLPCRRPDVGNKQEKIKMNLRNALIAAAVLAAPLVMAPGAVQAQALNGLYVGAGVGANWLTETSTNFGKMKSDGVGIAGVGSIGYGFGNGLRVELEGNYRYQTIKIGTGVKGYSNTYGPMVNVLYDFDAGLGVAVPYVGVGVGYQWGTYRVQGTNSDSKGAIAAQGILGAAFPIAAMPGLAITAEARVISTLEDVRLDTGNLRTDPQMNVSGMLGLRYAFGVAPAPVAAPAAVPAPAPARTYLVFFDWDKADLTPRARQIIADAAQASTRVATTRIEVGGHADRTGTAQYNQQLSMRRAQNVAAELVRLGVARNAIDINAFGDTRPLVATGPNTREPQNRRVEIVLR
jgi:outer membrane protein OmpA-like peptidoglycan-associated protein